MNNNWHKKEKPLLGLTGLGGGVDGLAVVGAATKAYVDDVFSSYVYTGDGTNSHQIVNGIDLSSKGGFIWGKERGNSGSHYQFDTVRGLDKRLKSNSSDAEETDTFYSSVNSDGYTISKTTSVNVSGNEYVSWTFAKQKGFFDVVSWTGNGSNRTISHSLGCVPGMIIVKRTDTSSNWSVYHRGYNLGVNPEQYVTFLDTDDAEASHATSWNNTAPTATEFSVGTHARVNGNGGEFIAYLFGGGESTASTATSVRFDGTGDYLDVSYNWISNFYFGTGDFTVECWVKPDSYNRGIFQISSTDGGITGYNFNDCPSLWIDTSGTVEMNAGGSSRTSAAKAQLGQWTHIAYVRNSGVTTLYVNGIDYGGYSDTTNYGGWAIAVGGYYNSSYLWDGEISNFRVVKGTAVYTSSFVPPTEPLTNITNTEFLCCQGSSVTDATVIPTGSISSNGDPTASTHSPFDDTQGYKFGEEGDENIVKCGYLTTDTSNGAVLHLPWEPQWFLYKRIDTTNNWVILDSVRDWTADGVVDMLFPNKNNAEMSGSGYEELRSRTIKFQGYGNNYDYIYMAIRRPDGYVAKPPEAGTEVFAMDTGNGSSTIPNFDSGFPVDFALVKKPAVNVDWYTGLRLTSNKFMYTNANSAEGTSSEFVFDSSLGWMKGTANDSSYQSWMWKRGQGFDMLVYDGDSVAGRPFQHSLNSVPEMLWIKRRDSATDWVVYHSGMSSTSHYMKLNNSNPEANGGTAMLNSTAPTSTILTLGDNGDVNADGDPYIAMLFSSVEGLSKVGSYTGNGSATERTITTGFQPRFLIVKNLSGYNDWIVFDTLRGWGSGNDYTLGLNATYAQGESQDIGSPVATGFTLTSSLANYNENGTTYIYYAHA